MTDCEISNVVLSNLNGHCGHVLTERLLTAYSWFELLNPASSPLSVSRFLTVRQLHLHRALLLYVTAHRQSHGLTGCCGRCRLGCIVVIAAASWQIITSPCQSVYPSVCDGSALAHYS